MQDTGNSNPYIKPLYSARSGELVLGPACNSRIGLAICLGERQRHGMPMAVLKGGHNRLGLPEPAWLDPEIEMFSLGSAWLIEPIGAADKNAHSGEPGLLLKDGPDWKLRLSYGPDNLGSVCMCYDLTKRQMLWPFDTASECYPQWCIWQSAADREDPTRTPLFEFTSPFLKAKFAA